MNEPILLRLSEAAKMLSVSRSTIYELIAKGEVPAIRLRAQGGRGLLRVPNDSLRKMIEARAAGGGESEP